MKKNNLIFTLMLHTNLSNNGERTKETPEGGKACSICEVPSLPYINST